MSSMVRPSITSSPAWRASPNIGRDRDWSGSTFNQANWYAFGRLAWDPDLSAQEIARAWAAQTFGNDPQVIDTVTAMMMGSREAVVDYYRRAGPCASDGDGASL